MSGSSAEARLRCASPRSNGGNSQDEEKYSICAILNLWEGAGEGHFIKCLDTLARWARWARRARRSFFHDTTSINANLCFIF